MAAVPNPVDGAMVAADGSLEPMPETPMPDGAGERMGIESDAMMPVALAMTAGRQMTAARRMVSAPAE